MLALVAPAPLALATPDLAARFLAAVPRSANTRDAYRRDLEAFAAWLGEPSREAAAARLVAAGQGGANELALAFRGAMREAGLAPSTRNRRLAALRSVVAYARVVGLAPWTLDVRAERAPAYRDTRGPGREGVAALNAAAARTEGAKGARDRALVRLLSEMALRRGEVVSLDLEHVDMAGGRLFVRGKGDEGRTPITMSPGVVAALEAYLAERGDEPGPLFRNHDRAAKGDGQRLTGRSVARIVGALGEAAGLGPVRPHGLRHAGITAALDATGGDVRRVQQFSRHRDLNTLTKYDDNRRDVAGELAGVVGAWFEEAAGTTDP